MSRPGRAGESGSSGDLFAGDGAFLFELLEPRIAPATLLADGKTVTYTDVDGDEVTVKFNQKLPQGTSIENVLKFDTAFANNGAQTLQTIDLTAWSFQPGKSGGFTVDVSTKQAGAGDGRTNVGQVIATEIDISTIKISGDLAKIRAGNDDDKVPGMKKLEVGSLGVGGVAAFGGTEGVDSLNSTITGIDKLKIGGNLEKANVVIDGTAGKIEIGGSVKGGTATDSGRLTVNGYTASIDIKGGIEGGAGNDSGVVTVNGDVRFFEVGGPIKGGGGTHSGGIKVTGDVKVYGQGGTLDGGSGEGSGFIELNGNLKKGKISGDFNGSTGEQTARFSVESFGSVTLAGINGGTGDGSGQFISQFGGSKAVVQGAISGGAGMDSGLFTTISAPVSSLTFSEALVGGSGAFSGGVRIAAGDINGDGVLDVVKSVSIPQINGSSGPSSGVFDISAPVNSFKGDFLRGGMGADSGVLSFGSYAMKVSLTMDIQSLAGGMGSGVLTIAGNCDFLNIAGARGGTATVGGNLEVFANKFGTFLGSGGNGFTLNVGGSLGKASIAGPATNLTVTAVQEIGSLGIKQDASGLDVLAGYSNATTPTNPNATIGAVKIGGSLQNSHIWAGVADFDGDGEADIIIGNSTSATPQIGSVSVGAPASNSSIVSALVIQASIDGEKAALTAGPGNDEVTIGSFSILELGG